MRTWSWTPVLCVLLVMACVDTSEIFVDGPLPGDSGAVGADRAVQFPDQAPAPDGVTPYSGEPVVYAHSSSRLYRIDPTTLALTLIGVFQWSPIPDVMTDIAVDRKGKMTGISFSKVYSVDTKTAACTYLATLDTLGSGSFNGLSYISVQGVDTKEVLMASNEGGDLFEVDPATGKSKKAGSYGGGYGSSGDLVSVQGFGTLATVKTIGSSSTDWLARLDPATGQATLIGDTGFKNIWGLGFWKNKVYGFSDDTQFILIDPKTGKGTLVSTSATRWWGAGVTTSAPVIK